MSAAVAASIRKLLLILYNSRIQYFADHMTVFHFGCSKLNSDIVVDKSRNARHFFFFDGVLGGLSACQKCYR